MALLAIFHHLTGKLYALANVLSYSFSFFSATSWCPIPILETVHLETFFLGHFRSQRLSQCLPLVLLWQYTTSLDWLISVALMVSASLALVGVFSSMC